MAGPEFWVNSTCFELESRHLCLCYTNLLLLRKLLMWISPHGEKGEKAKSPPCFGTPKELQADLFERP
jgi:hypothetical protein